jgi:hypothetical protein
MKWNEWYGESHCTDSCDFSNPLGNSLIPCITPLCLILFWGIEIWVCEAWGNPTASEGSTRCESVHLVWSIFHFLLPRGHICSFTTKGNEVTWSPLLSQQAWGLMWKSQGITWRKRNLCWLEEQMDLKALCDKLLRFASRTKADSTQLEWKFLKIKDTSPIFPGVGLPLSVVASVKSRGNCFG